LVKRCKKPSPAGEGWVRGNKIRENAYLYSLIPTFSLREKEHICRVTNFGLYNFLRLIMFEANYSHPFEKI
jgi:hypothetical protein